MSVEPPMIALQHRVCATRNLARKLIEAHPDVSPGLAVYLRCDKAPPPDPTSFLPAIKALYERNGVEPNTDPGVQIMTPSFADEILKAWPKAQLVGAHKELQLTFDFACERHRSRSS